MKILPHRYPFLFVDRVIEIEPGKKGIGIKNVTINDGFFQGHFPQKAGHAGSDYDRSHGADRGSCGIDRRCA